MGHFGKVHASRSEKPKIKKAAKPDDKPQYEKDYELYLGDIAQILLTD